MGCFIFWYEFFMPKTTLFSMGVKVSSFYLSNTLIIQSYFVTITPQ
ncbi:hypothetical protein HMPREF1405_00046 [Helicobacter pylori GAM231Ai]|nr:hypothetical protein HMPREF1405_00046 [Helicobacter pylori GAM231Ai]